MSFVVFNKRYTVSVDISSEVKKPVIVVSNVEIVGDACIQTHQEDKHADSCHKKLLALGKVDA